MKAGPVTINELPSYLINDAPDWFQHTIPTRLTPVTLYVTFAIVIRSFRHKGLEKFFMTGSKGGITATHAKRLRLILGRLEAAHEPRDMNLPGLRLHKLAGKLESYWAVGVSGNWRVLFQFHDHAAWNIDYLDYH